MNIILFKEIIWGSFSKIDVKKKKIPNKNKAHFDFPVFGFQYGASEE